MSRPGPLQREAVGGRPTVAGSVGAIFTSSIFTKKQPKSHGMGMPVQVDLAGVLSGGPAGPRLHRDVAHPRPQLSVDRVPVEAERRRHLGRAQGCQGQEADRRVVDASA